MYQNFKKARPYSCARNNDDPTAHFYLLLGPLADVGKAFEKYYDNPMAYTNIPADKISFTVGMICVLDRSAINRAPGICIQYGCA